ncbi:MAG: zinc-binding dehydrogenase [Alphaproteobacteria bacterium]
MKAAVLYEFGKDMAVEEVRLADPKDREVLLRITAAGVCHSDLSTARGKGSIQLPTILGHEATAVVERVGPGTSRAKKGASVILSWSPACGACFFCRAGFPTSCEVYNAAAGAGGLWDGTSRLSLPSGERISTFACQSSFAEYAVMPETGCVPIPESISRPVAALVGCAVTTGFGAAVNDAKVRPGDSVAIWGLGGVGLSALMGAKLSGAEIIIAVDVNPKKEAVARRFGVTHFINPKTEGDVPGAIKALTKGRGADATFDCIGKSAVFEQAFDSARAGGTIVVVGQAAKGEAFRIPSGRNLMAAQKRIVGSHYGGGVPEHDFLRILGLYSNGKLDLDALIGKTIPLQGINDAFRELEAGIDTRTVITFT